jgi:hypothetical protein
MAIQWCDNGAKHVGPYFSIAAHVLESGPGSGIKGYKRIQAHQVIARLCSECLRTAVIRLEGAKLISLEAQDPVNG